MKVKPELANVLRQASQEVSSWEPWQRSRDPHGCVARSLPVSQETETAQRQDLCPIHTAEYHADRVPATLPEHSGSKLIITVRPA